MIKPDQVTLNSGISINTTMTLWLWFLRLDFSHYYSYMDVPRCRILHNVFLFACGDSRPFRKPWGRCSVTVE